MANTIRVETQQANILSQYRAFLLTAFASPAVKLFSVLYVLATIYLVIAEHVSFVLISLFALLFLILCLLVVIPLTRGRPAPAWEDAAVSSRSKLLWQCGCLFCYFLLLIALPSILLGRLGSGASGIFLIAELLPPLLIALLLGARWRELGFERGYHAWRVTIVLLILALIPFIIGILSSKNYAITTLLLPVAYIISAGIPEEIGFRGVLTTRFIRLFGAPWGMVLASLLFGLAHFSGNFNFFHVSAPGSLAFCIAFQAPLGLALAFILQRTRNLIAGILFHGFLDGANFVLLPLVLPFLLRH